MDNMATPHNGSYNKVDRAVIDTRIRFESVKAAVSLFGERGIEDKIYKKNMEIPAEKGQISKETQLHILQKEVIKLREQLKAVEAMNLQVQVELAEAKKDAEGLSLTLENATESSKKANNASEIARLRAKELETSNAEVSNYRTIDWKSKLTAARNDHMAATDELEAAKQDLRKLKQEFQTCLEAKAFAGKQAEDAISKMKINSLMAEELTKEINEAQKIHILVKMACKEADTEKNLIGSEREGDTQKASVVVEKIRKQIMVFTLDLVNAQNLEKELASTTAEVESLKNELNLAKETESKICNDAFHPIEKLKKVMKEIENTNKQESDALSLLESINFELAKEKGYLKKVIEEGCALRASMDSLKAELERKKIELAELNEIEAQAEAKAADLNSELHRAKFKLEAAIAAEAKVKDGASYLSQTIQNLIAEAEEAKKDAESMVEKARKAKVEIEQSKTETVTINSRLEATHTELVEAKAAEAIAVKQINDLSGRANTARASNSEFGAGITISLSEFDALGRKVEEADRLADKKVAAVVAQIDAIKAGEQEISMKLELANQEIEDLKSEQQEELQKAEIATAAKRAIEGELVRWRDHEQQNKATPRRTTSDFLISGKENIPVSFVESKILNSEPLVKELNGNDLSEMQENLWSGSFSSKKKKKQIIPNIRRLFTRNKRVGSSLR